MRKYLTLASRLSSSPNSNSECGCRLYDKGQMSTNVILFSISFRSNIVKRQFLLIIMQVAIKQHEYIIEEMYYIIHPGLYSTDEFWF